MKKVLLGVTGSVAATLTTKLVSKLESNFEVKVVPTIRAGYFIYNSSVVSNTPYPKGYYTELDEWTWVRKGDPIMHIELRKWADLFLIAPLTANTLAKISNGLCDNLLTSIARAWDFDKPMIVAPACNSLMYSHPITSQQLHTLETWGVKVIDPVEKTLACGDTGIGAMADIDTIVKLVNIWSY